MNTLQNTRQDRFRFGMFIVAIGIVYGDIGTSPMYVMRSILEGNGGIGQVTDDFIIGSLSLIMWTITLLTTVKYVLIAMKADNHGEGGIFALYTLVRRYGRWLIIPAMIGGATLLADGVLTPAVTVTTAVEGLRSITFFDRLLGPGQLLVILITLGIIAALFLVQRTGTEIIGRMFGPVMLIWFAFLGCTGLWKIIGNPIVLKAFNPLYAIQVLISPDNKAGFLILGSVFLATTGAEALYSDMGHVGKTSVYVSWPLVKICLFLNYMGQGAWILLNRQNPDLIFSTEMNPFYDMLPVELRPFAIILGALAAIIASQALISGSYTMVSEAIRLDLMPHMQIQYPSTSKGQLYIPLVNTVLWVGCSMIVLLFQSSSRMEAAYGLSITITMLMTTVLLAVYLWKLRGQPLIAVLVGTVFGAIQMVFFVSSLSKFTRGGYVALLMATVLFAIMLAWDRGTHIEQSQFVRLRVRDYIPNITALRADETIPKTTENMVYLSKETNPEMIDRDILYSILDKDPKRAEAYWFVSVNVTEEPYDMSYSVETYGTDFLFHVSLKLGFRVNQRINLYLRQIVTDLLDSGELPPQNRKYSIYGPSPVGNFKFCMIRKMLRIDAELSSLDSFFISLKYAIRRVAGSPVRWYGLETSSIIMEYVPLFIRSRRDDKRITREYPEKETAAPKDSGK